MGIPKSDLVSSVQTSLDKADTALQSHQDISGKQDKTGDASNTTVAFSAASARENVKTGEKLFTIVGKIAKWFADLKTVAFTGSYNDLANKPTIPDGSKYLPLSGGKMTGDINMATNGKDIVVGAHRSAAPELPTAVAGGTVSEKLSLETGLPERRSLIGSWLDQNSVWHNILSVRHKNGCNDGPNYGFYLRSLLISEGNLAWNKQTGVSEWQGERTLLDSGNYTSYALDKNGTAVSASKLSSGLAKFCYVCNADETANSGYVWARVGYCTTGVGYETTTISLLVTRGYAGVGLFSICFRNASTGKACENISLEQIFTNKPLAISKSNFKFVAVYNSSSVTYELWYRTPGRWNSYQFVCLGENQYAGGNTNKWVLESHNGNTFKTAPTTGNKEAEYYDNGIVAAAQTLTDSGWVAMTLGTYAASGTVQYRTYGKQTTITGRIVLKTEIKPTPNAPQAIANTTLDFSKIKGCSGFGRSSTGVGVYIQAEQFNDDNIVDVFSIDNNIAAGSTIYFTITGFID